jgi:hypothetical protein
MAVSAPPKKKETEVIPVVSEEEISKVINKGGSPVKVEKKARTRDKTKPIRAIAVSLTSEEIDLIIELRNHRPTTSRTKKITISLHDWILEAVSEKIEREKKKYQI